MALVFTGLVALIYFMIAVIFGLVNRVNELESSSTESSPANN